MHASRCCSPFSAVAMGPEGNGFAKGVMERGTSAGGAEREVGMSISVPYGVVASIAGLRLGRAGSGGDITVVEPKGLIWMQMKL
jgi:hypothetical protein